MHLGKIINRIQRESRGIFYALVELYFFKIKKRDQRSNFEAIREKFPEIVKSLKKHEKQEFVVGIWEEFNREVGKALLPYPKIDFLRNPVIQTTMHISTGGKDMQKKIDLLRMTYAENELSDLLEEEMVGIPVIRSARYMTSHCAVWHIYNIARYEICTKQRVGQCQRVMEWGGGYGKLASIIRKINVGCTYMLVDTPLFCAIQWLYLASVFGEEAVNLVNKSSMAIKEGFINVVPVGLIDDCQFSPDLFIATWSLSESSAMAQDYVDGRDFFKSEKLLIAFQESSSRLPNASRIRKITEKRGACIETIDLLPGNYYAFL